MNRGLLLIVECRAATDKVSSRGGSGVLPVDEPTPQLARLGKVAATLSEKAANVVPPRGELARAFALG